MKNKVLYLKAKLERMETELANCVNILQICYREAIIGNIPLEFSSHLTLHLIHSDVAFIGDWLEDASECR